MSISFERNLRLVNLYAFTQFLRSSTYAGEGQRGVRANAKRQMEWQRAKGPPFLKSLTFSQAFSAGNPARRRAAMLSSVQRLPAFSLLQPSNAHRRERSRAPNSCR